MIEIANEMRQPISVLVVDDDPGILDAYRTTLTSERPAQPAALNNLRAKLFPSVGTPAASAASGAHFVLQSASGAQEAIDLAATAHAAGQPFSVVFLDMRMPPGPDGLWAATRLRALDPDLDIVICTAYSDVDPREFNSRVPPEDKLLYLQKPFHPHEVRQLAIALGYKRRAEKRIRQLAFYDDLTGLQNRESFRFAIDAAIEIAKEQQQICAVLHFDLDNFKRVNDALGRTAGDELLRVVARRLSATLREGDLITRTTKSAGAESSLARLGGDEFTVLLPHIGKKDDAGNVVERLLAELSMPVKLQHCELLITPSVGIAVYPNDAADANTLLKYADLAMYHSKRRGPGSYAFFVPAMNETSVRRIAFEGLLRRALDNGEFTLNYQPQLEMRDGSTCGMEALIRWTCPELGPVGPAEFIPIAEECGLILPIGEWVLREACRQAKLWRSEGLPLSKISVNVAMLQFMQREFAGLVALVLTEIGLPASCLELEITESMLFRDESASIQAVESLRAVGVGIAIDDFGTGYSSLSRLKSFRVHRLKIDRSFITGIPGSEDDTAIASAIIGMARTLGLKVVAEGVEEPAQLEFLRAQKCDEVQGFLFSKPLNAGDARKFLMNLHQVDLNQAVPPTVSPSIRNVG